MKSLHRHATNHVHPDRRRGARKALPKRRATAFLLPFLLAAQALLQLTPAVTATTALPAAEPDVAAAAPASVSVALDNGFGIEPYMYNGFNSSLSHGNPQSLTSAGPTDWRTWGENSISLAGDDRKAGGAGISDLVNINPAPPISLRAIGNLGLTVGTGASSVPFSFGWSDGAPVASATAARAGLQHNNNTSSLVPGYGFSFTVHASADTHRLTLWVSAHHGTGKLTATLGGITQTDLGVSGGQNRGGVYTIDYVGDGTPGQTMNVSFVLDSAVSPITTPDEVGLASDQANVVVYAAALSGPPPVAAPVLYQATPVTGSQAKISGRISASPSTLYQITVKTATTCPAGVLGGGAATLGTFSTTTDESGDADFAGLVPIGAGLQTFVTATVSGPAGLVSVPSNCVVGGPDNDTWPRALAIGAGTVPGYIDDAGRARWFKVAIQPGSRIHLNLTNLPADYDVFLFKDIGKAFSDLANSSDLTRLSAEFAPSAFSPSAFSPSAFSPSAFSPSAFSPSAFSPSAFSPSAFSPSAFSPSAFSPSAFSPSAFSAETYASAQIRSLITGSAASGLADETVVADTWNNTGYFYIRVSGKNGASSITSPFSLGVSLDASVCDGVNPIAAGTISAPAGSYKTLVLTAPSRMSSTLAGNSAADKTTLNTKLTAFVGRSEIAGVVVDVGVPGRIANLQAQADAHTSCMYAKNLVAFAIRDVIRAYRATNPGLKYIVIVGGDAAIPFFRYPDQALLGPESEYQAPVLTGTASEASLRSNYVLGQDAYGASIDLSLRASTFPIPGLPVGRLVESAAEASGMIDAYMATTGGVIAAPTRSLVTGYDFLADAAGTVSADLAAGMGTNGTVDNLITDKEIAPGQLCDATHSLPNCSWNATALRTALVGSRHDLIFLAGHFSANNALAADFQTTLATTDIATANLANSIVFSAGCHSGYNVVDPDAVTGGSVDWAQAFAGKQATLIAGTGYQYGDTDFLEYSERIYAEFAHQLRVGSGPVSIGDALMRSKQVYLANTPDIRGLHEKALLESSIFGLPMLSVNMPGTRDTTSGAGSIIGTPSPFGTDPGQELGLSSVDTTITSQLDDHLVGMTNLGGGTTTAKYYSGSNGVVTNPDEPAIPLETRNVTVPNEVLRGVGFRGGTYSEETVVPLTGAPADPQNQIRGIHRGFASPVFFPMRLWTPNYFDALTPGGTTNLLVTPAQHRGTGLNDGTALLRKYSNVDLRLFYSHYIGASAKSGAPTITGVNAVVSGSNVTFSARAIGDPSAGMQQVWVTYTGDANAWVSVDLIQDPIDSTLWSKTMALPTAMSGRSIEFMVQAVNGVGLVSLDDNGGRYYATGGKSEQVITFAPIAPKSLGDPDFAVTATSSAGLTPVTFTAAGGCTVTGSTVHITAVGPCTLTASQVGNASYYPTTATLTIQVIWPYAGFFSPVDNLPVDNVASAGSAIPVKFSLGGNRGMAILALGSPTITRFTCGSDPSDVIEEVSTATTSGLQYDTASGKYTYIWKTLKSYAGSCYQLRLTLVDGTTHAANFKFK